MKVNWSLLVVFIIFVVIFNFAFSIVALYNEEQYNLCSETKNIANVSYKDGLIIDTCYINDNGEDLTFKEFYKKHKFDGIPLK